MFVKLALESLRSRKGSVSLTILAITISVFVLLAVEHIRHQAKESFNRTVSGVDLIVGPRSGQLNLLLSSVFRLGSTNNSISWQAYEKLTEHPMVTWTAPIALGDSHKGLPVIATTTSYFEHFKYGNKQSLTFSEGRPFNHANEVVLGAEVADKFQYDLGKQIILSHGTGVTSFMHHDQAPFTVVGILARTGTPVDQSLHITFAGLDLMHESETPVKRKSLTPKRADKSQSHDNHAHDNHAAHKGNVGHDNHGANDSQEGHNGLANDNSHSGHDDHSGSHSHHAYEHDDDEHHSAEHQHAEEYRVSAVFVGLKARYASLVMQKWANDYETEPLSAILPGVALTQLWRLVGSVEVVLQGIAILVLGTTLIGLATMLLASMRERSREIAILRVLGASPLFLFSLIELEVVLVTLVSCIAAMLALSLGLNLSAVYLAAEYGLFISVSPFTHSNFMLIGWVLLGSALVGLIPAVNAYRNSLQASLQSRR